MTYNITPELDKYPGGTIRLTKTGEYRLSLIIKGTDNNDSIKLRGYRVDSEFKRLIPPTASYFNRRLVLVTITPALANRIIAEVKRIAEPKTEELGLPTYFLLNQ